MNRTIKVFVILSVIILSCASTFLLTKHFISKSSYDKGYASGYDKGHKDGYYNGLSANTDPLSPPTKQEPAPQITTPVVVTPPTHCTSTRYGINNQFSSTDCY